MIQNSDQLVFIWKDFLKQIDMNKVKSFTSELIDSTDEEREDFIPSFELSLIQKKEIFLKGNLINPENEELKETTSHRKQMKFFEE